MKYTEDLLKKIIGNNKGTEREVEIPFMLAHLPEPPLKILDVGCSHSNIIYELDKLGYDIHGIDMVQCNPAFEKFYLGDARNMPYNDNEFDYILCISALEHFGKVGTPYKTDKVEDLTADVKAMREMYRVLKKGGKLILTLPVGYGEPHWYMWVRFYNEEVLQRILGEFDIISIRYSYLLKKNGKEQWHTTNKETAENIYSKDKINANVSLLLEK